MLSPAPSDAGLYLFHQGTNYTAYEMLGAHPKGDGAVFRVWAPNARAVSVVGDFNSWDPARDPMHKISGGVWEAVTCALHNYDDYKFAVTRNDGKVVIKADPYAFHSETRPGTNSKYYEIDGAHVWKDKKWLKNRAASNPYTSPLNIYEVHAGSWRRYPDGNFYDYRKLADELIPYVKQQGFTHIEFMPLSEYPLDMSWGYQTTGYFSPTSRYGDPGALMEFIDRCHCAGVGVIMDWAAAHFPRDEFGLFEFDGGFCYESADKMRRESPDWGTNYFDYGRGEVACFLISNADYWVSRFHIDGIRVDAVSSMLYLDYGRKAGEWRPNCEGGNHNLEAISLLRRLNAHITGKYPGVMMIAEESTSFPYITAPEKDGGLGFTFKWNMGWMNDTLNYMSQDSLFRGGAHSLLTFSMMYAFSEKYILPISHDEVVHGKKSLLDKMSGNYEQKFANMRLFRAYMTAHPGKKLLFMGSEYGPFREWDYAGSLEWFMTDFDAHARLSRYNAALNGFYLSHQALWGDDCGWNGFEWIAADDSDNNVIAFTRISPEGKKLVCVFNFSALSHPDYRIGVPECAALRQVFCSEAEEWGGTQPSGHPPDIPVQPVPMHGRENSAVLTLPPLCAVFCEPIEGRHSKPRKGDKK